MQTNLDQTPVTPPEKRNPTDALRALLKKAGQALRAVPGHFLHFCVKHSFQPTVLLAILIAVAGMVCFGVVYSFLHGPDAGLNHTVENTSRTTKFGWEDIGELATQAGYFTNIQVIREARDLWGWEIPGTQSKRIFSYDGVVKAGIDFSGITVAADEETMTVRVHIPAAHILSIEVDEKSLEVYDETSSVFTPLTVDTMNNSMIALKEETRQTAYDNHLLENAASNAELLIKTMLYATYTPDVYTFVFEHEPALMPETEGAAAQQEVSE